MSSEEIEKYNCPKCSMPFSPPVKFCKTCGENLAAKLASLLKAKERKAQKAKLLNKWKRISKLLLRTVIIVVSIVVLAGAALFIFNRVNEPPIPAGADGEWGFINRRGEFVISPQFEAAYAFSDGLARVRSDGRIGYVNRRGELVIPTTFRDGTAFNNGLAFVVSDGGHPTAIDNRGNVRFVLNTAETVSAFSEGLAVFTNHDGQRRFVDRSGNVVADAAGRVFNERNIVRSDFYDASEFINQFFEREDGNTFDGISASTTLAALSEHPVYGAGLNAQSEHLADFRNRIAITTDIAISQIQFYFRTPIFSRVNGGQQFDFAATPDAIVYTFSLSGRARDRSGAVASALQAEIEHRHGQTMSNRSIRVGRGFYYLSQDDGRLSFVIEDLGAETVRLTVFFNSELVAPLFQ